MKKLTHILIAISFFGASLGYSENLPKGQVPIVAGVVRPATINAEEAEKAAEGEEPCRIELRFPKSQKEFVEYSRGSWHYVIRLAVPRGRSSIYSGTLLVNGATVIVAESGAKIRTPFGIMQYSPDDVPGYFRGWLLVEGSDKEGTEKHNNKSSSNGG